VTSVGFKVVASASVFYLVYLIGSSSVINLEKEYSELTLENDLLVDLTFHDFPVSLVAEFAMKIAQPYFGGNLKKSILELMQKALADQELIVSHINCIQNPVE